MSNKRRLRRGCTGTVDAPSDEEQEVHVSGMTNTMTGEIDVTYTMSTFKRPRQEGLSTVTTTATSSGTSAAFVQQPILPLEQPSMPLNTPKSDKPKGDRCKQV